MLRQIFILLGLISLLSCQSNKPIKLSASDLILSENLKHSDLILSENLKHSDLKFPESLSLSQKKEDIEFLKYALANAYIGKSYAPNINLQLVFENLDKSIESKNIDQFHDSIDSILFQINDNHLYANYKGHKSKVREDYLKINKGRVGENIAKSSDVWSIKKTIYKNSKILLIGINRFPIYSSKVWNGFTLEIKKNLAKVDSIIIDLRGNTGGDDSISIELANLLYTHSYKHSIKLQYILQTPESMALAYNNTLISKIYDLDNSEATSNAKYRKELFQDSLFGKLDTLRVRNKEEIKNYKQGKGFNKPIFILIDRECGSSCEFAVKAFNNNEFVKTVGESTSGTIHFSNTGLLVLPNSKIKVFIPSQYNELDDKSFIERLGIKPDIETIKDKDAYFELLQKL